jgi:hypothetical protein
MCGSAEVFVRLTRHSSLYFCTFVQFIRLRSGRFTQDILLIFFIITASMDARRPTHIISLTLISLMPFADAHHSRVSSMSFNPFLSRAQNILTSSILSCLLQRNRQVKQYRTVSHAVVHRVIPTVRLSTCPSTISSSYPITVFFRSLSSINNIWLLFNKFTCFKLYLVHIFALKSLYRINSHSCTFKLLITTL